ncbi:hypothetical protein BKI52_10195 [marine bacterium AO1-C]|nr:hypothetical protein BKI52_10195 [marine bacterium AO1-C]
MLNFYRHCFFLGLWISVLGSSLQINEAWIGGSFIFLIALIGFSVINMALDTHRNKTRNLITLNKSIFIPLLAQASLVTGLFYQILWLWILGGVCLLPITNHILHLSSLQKRSDNQ